MGPIKSDKGFTLVVVIIALIILSTTILAVMASSRSQTNLRGMTEGTTNALSHAEKGLTLAVTKLDNDEDIGSGFTFTDTDGWNVALSMVALDTNGNYRMESKAVKGRYSRTIAMDVFVPKKGSPFAADFACFSGGDILSNSGNNGVINLNNEKFFANGDVGIGVSVDGGGNGKLMAHGDVTANNLKNGQKVGEQQAVDFPELDFAKITEGQPTCRTSQLQNSLNNLNNNGGGTLVVKVSGPEVNINFNINVNNEVTLVFVKDAGYTGDYAVHFKADCWNINGKLNLLSDGGTYHFNSFSLASKGVIYTNYDPGEGDYSIHVNNDFKSFNPGGMIVKGDVYINNANYNVQRNPANYWGFLDDYWIRKVKTTNWREL